MRAGLGINLEQGLADGGTTGIFARLGLADGDVETENYAEADESFSIGGQISGSHWKRKDDIIGLAFGLDGISKEHQLYLAQGGLGFNIGDGALRYGPQSVFETYYLDQVTKRLQLTGDIQIVSNPGYNRDRGPAAALSVHARYTF